MESLTEGRLYLPRAAWSIPFSSGPSSGDWPWQATRTLASQLNTREEKAPLVGEYISPDKFAEKPTGEAMLLL